MQNFVFIFRGEQFKIMQIIGILKCLEHYILIKKTFHILNYSERFSFVWPCIINVGEERTNIHIVRSACVPTPHNRSQHIQANTTRGFIQSVLLTMGIMMSETCWANLLWIKIYTCVICWFFLLILRAHLFTIASLKTCHISQDVYT